jgi:transposase-like protein
MSDFKGRHFEGGIVLWAVRSYCRYGISYRDLEQMMVERGVSVDHSTIYRWVQKCAPEIEKRLRWQWRRHLSTSWRVDGCAPYSSWRDVKKDFPLTLLQG